MTGPNVPAQRAANAATRDDEVRNDAALAAIRDHHATLDRDLAGRVDHVLTAVRTGPHQVGEHGIADEVLVARRALVTFLFDQLLPHAAAEERSLYPAAAADPHTASLVWAMLDEHRTLTELANRLRAVTEPLTLATTAAALRTLFAVHMHKENEYLLPALRRSGADLEAVLTGAHPALAGSRHDFQSHGLPNRPTP